MMLILLRQLKSYDEQNENDSSPLFLFPHKNVSNFDFHNRKSTRFIRLDYTFCSCISNWSIIAQMFMPMN